MPAKSSSKLPNKSPDPEAPIRSAHRAGDRERVLEYLMDLYGVEVFRCCRRLIPDQDRVEEAHQMTFVQAYEGLRRFRGEASYKTWLLRIARNRCLDLLKVDRRRQRRFLQVVELPEVASSRVEAEKKAWSGELRQVLASCLEQLAPRAREALILRFGEGMSYREIGELTGDRAGSLQMRVTRALPPLRRCLEHQGVVNG